MILMTAFITNLPSYKVICILAEGLDDWMFDHKMGEIDVEGITELRKYLVTNRSKKIIKKVHSISA